MRTEDLLNLATVGLLGLVGVYLFGQISPSSRSQFENVLTDLVPSNAGGKADRSYEGGGDPRLKDCPQGAFSESEEIMLSDARQLKLSLETGETRPTEARSALIALAGSPACSYVLGEIRVEMFLVRGLREVQVIQGHQSLNFEWDV